MDSRSLRLPQNVAGDFFVDSSCIDCDTCRQIAPASFRDHGGQSSVFRQPETKEDVRRALMALVSCPTASIGTASRRAAREGIEAFPSLVSTSAASLPHPPPLLARRKRLVDSPRFAAPLLRRLHELGGVRTMFLTHRDDVAEHARLAREFGCGRIMHAADGAAALGIERVVEELEPARLDGDMLAIPTPGHTRGHMVLLYRERFLFTGDHVAWSPERMSLTAFRDVAWYSWDEQIRSMKRLRQHRFEWVLPGHGRIHHDTVEAMRSHLEDCIRRMSVDPD